MSIRLSAIALICALLTGCGDPPPPSGNLRPNPTQQVGELLTLVDTEPKGIRCTISGGRIAPETISTPRLVSLSAHAPAATIDCFSDGYFRSRKTVLPAPGNSLASRIPIRGGVDPAFGPDILTASGNRTGYPQWVRLRMHRDAFNSTEERDRFYASEAEWTRKAWDGIKRWLEVECQRDTKPQAKGLIILSMECKKAFRIIEERRSADLSLVEVNRRQSTIR